MKAAFIMLASLIILLPTLMMADGILANGVVAAIAASAILTVACTLHARDLNRLSHLLAPIALVGLFIPCLWMLSQVLPVATRSLTRPVWASTAGALDRRFVGTISLDIGATLVSLARYCSVLAAAFVTAAITLSKPRAEKVLSFLAGIAALIAAGLIGYDVGYLRLAGYGHPGVRADAMNVAIIGLILSLAMTIRAYQQVDGIRGHQRSRMAAIATASASLVVLLICLSAILISADPALPLAGLFGTGVPISVSAIRRWRLGPFGQAGIVALAAVASFGFFAVAPAKEGADPTLALSRYSQVSSVERMLSDAKWPGSGAGSFEALFPLYRATDEIDSLEIPTAAATIAIEMGRSFLWICVVVALIGAWTLFRRAILRGQDHIYSCAGAGCIVALLILLFANDGILGSGASLMIGAVCGLAFAQSKSARNREPTSDAASWNRTEPRRVRAARSRGSLLRRLRHGSVSDWPRSAFSSLPKPPGSFFPK
jgi:hypothetical protein